MTEANGMAAEEVEQLVTFPEMCIRDRVGTDVNFLDNLITFSYTYSRQNVKDQIFEVPLASSTGCLLYTSLLCPGHHRHGYLSIPSGTK